METKKVTLTMMPRNHTVTLPAGLTLADAAMESGIMINTPCGGKGVCKKCTVKAEGMLSERDGCEKNLGDGALRLACRATMLGNAVIWTDAIRENIKFPALNPLHTYNAAVDIGTTTIQIAFVDAMDGTVSSEITLLNPQRRFGHDVITRISHASNRETASKLTHLLVNTIAGVIETACKASNVDARNITSISVSGNTAMTYSLLGIDIAPLGMHPYSASITSFDDFRNYPPLLKYFPHAALTVLPVASAFLGGDFLGGIGTLHHHKGNNFFFDIGTNGEMAIIRQNAKIAAASCAMGPALEGMNISSGMTASEGAITHVMLNDSMLTYTAIGKPAGISGTALVDIIAILLQTGIIDSTGAINTEIPEKFAPHILCEYRSGIKALKIFNTVMLTQNDIRNVQLAKGASLAASTLLLKESGLSIHDIDNVYIAGAFGKNVTINNFTMLSFIPHFPKAVYHAVGNTSLQAAIEIIRNKGFAHSLQKIKNILTVVDLSVQKEFNDVFLTSLDFKN